MKVKDLIDKLKGFEDFDIEFHFDDRKLSSEPFYFRKFSNLDVCDVSFSDKLVVLDGNEKD